MLVLLSLTVLIAIAPWPGTSSQETPGVHSLKKDLVLVGDIMGPTVIDNNVTEVQSSLELCWSYKGKQDVLVNFFPKNQVFQNVADMYEHIKSVVTDDSAVIQVDPVALEGKFLEVLSNCH